MIQDQIDDLTGVSRPVEVKVFGPDAATLRGLAAQIGEFVEKAGAKDVNSNVHLGNPDLIVRPRREAIARMGLSEQDIENQLNAALYGEIATTLPQQDRITEIRVRYPDTVRFNRNRLEQLPIALPAAGRQERLRAKRRRPSSRSARWRRSKPSGVPTRSGGRTSSL